MKTLALTIALLGLTVSAHGTETAVQDGQTIGKINRQNKRIALGNVYLSESDRTKRSQDNDTFALQTCSSKKNARVTALILRAPTRVGAKENARRNLDSKIKSITLVFENGSTQTRQINTRLVVTPQEHDQHIIRFTGSRCIRAVTVIGEQFERGRDKRDALVRVVGVLN